MNSDELYQEVILDHNRRPRNFGKLEQANSYSHGVNPLCGDDYHLYLSIDPEGVIQDVKFEGSGCAISKSSASMMTAAIQHKSAEEAGKLKKSFVRLLTGGSVSERERSELGKLKIFEGVRQYPIRVKCATLIWHALADALQGSDPQNRGSDPKTKETR